MKRMILVDEREYNERWNRPPVAVTKSHLNNKLESQLNSTVMSDDEKVKQYQNTLTRFLNLKQRMPDLQPTSLNSLFDNRPSVRKTVKRKRGPIRTSLRKHVKWSKYNE
jgi:hypothetical protein